jgi:hypothetical protein
MTVITPEDLTLPVIVYVAFAISVQLLNIFLIQPRHYKKQTPWPKSASELYGQSYCLLSAKLVANFADGECHVVNVMHPYSSILGFLHRSHCFSFQVALLLYSRVQGERFPSTQLERVDPNHITRNK